MADVVDPAVARPSETEASSVSPVVKAASIEPPSKPVHTIILDSSPLLLNTPTLSTLLSQSHVLVATQSVISEIRDSDARSRIENLYLPFLQIKSPKPESIKFVKEFARKTGDAAVLSGTDFELLALAYDLECERNGGDWRLRRSPGQKRVNGSKPIAITERSEEADSGRNVITQAQNVQDVTEELQGIKLQEVADEPFESGKNREASLSTTGPLQENIIEDTASSDSDLGGWITPSNIKKHQAKGSGPIPSSKKLERKTLQVATMTADFAMQNVLLQMNLNLLSSKTCKRIDQLKQNILRCHGCFNITKEMDKQFCPRCGKPTLTRVSCTTNDKGEVRLHLKANMQWNNKGNVFSIPKPVSGRSNQRWTGPRDGGGKSGWGRELVLAEDQKEYVRAMTGGERQSRKKKDLMDEDYLPSILSGERNGGGGKIRVGAGRNINARKR